MLSSPENQRLTHAVFAKLNPEDLERINDSFIEYKLGKEILGGSPFYTIPIKEIELTIKSTTTVPDEQMLLMLSHGEGIEPDVEAAKKYSERKERIDGYHKNMLESGLPFYTFLCPDTYQPLEFTKDDLNAAKYGVRNKESGELERRPIPFSKMDSPETKWGEFQKEIKEIFAKYAITDAEVHILGSAGTGFSGNPKKPFKAWTHKSDLDCAIFSKQLSLRCAKSNIAVNTIIVQGDQYTVYKNKTDTGSSQSGFHDTTLGKELERVQQKWSSMLYEKYTDVQAKGDEVDIKVNIGTVPFASTIRFKV